MYSTSELEELFHILNSIKGFKLNNHKGATQQYESSLKGTPAHEDNPSNSEAKGAMATTPVANYTPAVSAAPESLTSPSGEEQTRSMEVNDGDDSQPLASPVSHREDEFLTGGDVVGVEGEMANLMVSSLRGGDNGDKGASTQEAPPISMATSDLPL